MGVYCTGDTHRIFSRFEAAEFPDRKDMGRGDYMIICGDFGGVWDGEPGDTETLDWLEALPFTTLFVCGNHENFDELYRYPVEEWQGGRVHRIRPHVLHLMRGQVFTLAGHSFFTMGGARSVDVRDGILDPDDPDFAWNYCLLRLRRGMFRVKHLSWWEQELPSTEEYGEALRNLERVNHEVDYIITHCAPDSVLDEMGCEPCLYDGLTYFLERVKNETRFRRWLFGHYHGERMVGERFQLLYEGIIQLI
ncbi:MAG: metallophosphoesterase [Oscillospiraceae bacterium]|nr:metallophosphoesterase [Oscillospiraceae bacterium]